jgi:hypothetical protein
MTRNLLIFLLVFLFAGGAPADALTVFNDRPLFGSSSGAGALETFENTPLIGTADGGAVFKKNFENFTVSVKQPNAAVKILDAPVFGAGNTTPFGSHYLYLDTDRSSQGSVLRIAFKFPVWGVGFDYSQLSARGTSASVTLAGETFSLPLNPYADSPGEFNPLFWGAVSDRPFSRLIIDSGIDSGFGIDDLVLTAPVPAPLESSTPVPEPGTFLLLAAGLGALTALRRRVKKAKR